MVVCMFELDTKYAGLCRHGSTSTQLRYDTIHTIHAIHTIHINNTHTLTHLMMSLLNTWDTTISPVLRHSSQARSNGLAGEYTTDRSFVGRGGICEL